MIKTPVMMLTVVVVMVLAVLCGQGNGEYFRRGKLFTHNINNVKDRPDVKTLWFNQTLNHFNPSDTREWKQRYFVNDTFYKPGGPVFLMIGGEGEANTLWMTQGAWIVYAEKLNAYCIQIEHRFYGKSQPTIDASINNLAYLTSEQALADLAQFTTFMKKTQFPTNKWVAFGGSYPGSLAAWYRMKYPHLVDMAVSSSAPLVAQLDFKEYLGVVETALNRTNSGCAGQIQEAVASIENLLKRRTGWQMIQKTFNLCDTFAGDNRKDVANLFETLAGNFMDIVQYNEDNRAFEGSKTANITIATLCDIMTNTTGGTTAMDKYAEVNALLLTALNESCTDYKYSKLIKRMQQSAWSSVDGSRQWTFQTCNEFGFYQSSDLEGQPFGNNFPIDFSVRQCRDVYGSKYVQDFIEKSIVWTNANYGGKNLKVTRVIFVNGSIDPWHALGITAQNETTSDNLVIFIDGTAHCANMYPESEKDPKELKDARVKILEQLTAWLQQ